MIFENSVLFDALKSKSITTPERTLTIINEKKEDIHVRSKHEETYLHLIAHAYQKDEDAPYLLPVVFQLSNAGIDVCAVDQDGNTALHIAAKSKGSRRLIRALFLIGVDPTIENLAKQTALQLAKSNPDNLKVINQFYPGLWQAVASGNGETAAKLIANWCKVDCTRDDVKLSELAEKTANPQITEALTLRAKTINFAHFALAGDRQSLRPFFQKRDFNKDPVTDTYIDVKTGNFVSMPLVGEVALLCLTSVVRKMIRKKCDITFKVNEKPLVLYVLENITKAHDGFSDMYLDLIDKVDLSDFDKHTMEFLDAAYEKELPQPVMAKLASNGLDLFATDSEGHFLRDRILMKNASENPIRIADEMKFVDDVIVGLAEKGFVDYLRMLGESFYEHLVVDNRDGVSSLRVLIDTIGATEADKLVTYVNKVQKMFRDLCYVIKIGHFTQFEQLVQKRVARVKDKIGRTLVHHIVLFEREPMLKHYRKTCNPRLDIPDNSGRTPLFWACAVEEGREMETLLIAGGCSLDHLDKNGISPADVKNMNRKEKDDLLAKERSRDPGLDTYLFYRYMEIKEAIRLGDIGMVEDIRSSMYKDVPTRDIMTRMYQTNPPHKDILSFAIEAKRDGIAKLLLTLGMDWNVKYKDDKGEISLLEAAKKFNMKAVQGYIQYQIEEQEKEREALKKLKVKGVLKENKDTKDGKGNK